MAVAVAAALSGTAAAQVPVAPPWDSVAAVLQTPAVPSAGYVRFNLPRRDFTVRMAGVTLAVPLAAGAWAGFAGDAKSAVAMGDLVLTQAELGPVEAELLHQGLEITAIHNHLVGEEPRLVYVHFHGEGAALDLARRLDAVVAKTATPRPVATAAAPPVTIDTALVFGALGQRGRAQGSVAQLAPVLVKGKVRWHGHTLVPALAYASPINLQAVGPARTVATGDLALLAAQVGPVLRALAAHGVTAEALHTHLVCETPPVYFIHFWAAGPLADVARGLRAALDAAK